MIATLGNQWVHCDGPGAGAGSYKDDAWYTNGYKQPDAAGTQSYRDWVAEIVARYKNNPNILAWQLMNEAEVKPSEGSASWSLNAEQTLKAFATDVSGLVKSIDSNHLVSLGKIGGGQCGAQGDKYQDLHNIPTIDLCEYHDYGSPTRRCPATSSTACGAGSRSAMPLASRCSSAKRASARTTFHPTSSRVPAVQPRERIRGEFRAQFAAGVGGELVWRGTRTARKRTTTTSAPAIRHCAPSRCGTRRAPGRLTARCLGDRDPG